MEYLGLWVTWTNIRLINNKLEAILNMTPPKNKKEVRAFIVIMYYCRYMWAIRLHLLHLSTSLTSNKVKFKWTDVEHKSFDDIKRAVAHNTLLEYPDFNKLFDIHKQNSN